MKKYRVKVRTAHGVFVSEIEAFSSWDVWEIAYAEFILAAITVTPEVCNG